MKSTRAKLNARNLPRCAVIGCGAAAKEFVLPVLKNYPNARQSVVLVDCNIEQAAAVAQEFGVQHVCDDFRSLPIEVDAAIITSPHKFHAQQSLHFLQQKKHVFVEKPLGMTATEVNSMLNMAASTDCICMVNNYRRLFPSYRRVRDLIQSGQLGELRRITIFDGTQFAWNSASSFYLRDPQTRGVLLDRGAHTIDVLCWWLGKPPRVEAARSDVFNGVEGLMDVTLASANASIQIKFSRFYRLANCYTIEGDAATISGRLFDFGRLQLQRAGRVERMEAGKPLPHYEYAWQLLENFLQAVQGNEPPLFLAQEVAPSISVIDEAYRQATRFESPWYGDDPNIASLRHDFPSRR